MVQAITRIYLYRISGVMTTADCNSIQAYWVFSSLSSLKDDDTMAQWTMHSTWPTHMNHAKRLDKFTSWRYRFPASPSWSGRYDVMGHVTWEEGMHVRRLVCERMIKRTIISIISISALWHVLLRLSVIANRSSRYTCIGPSIHDVYVKCLILESCSLSECVHVALKPYSSIIEVHIHVVICSPFCTKSSICLIALMSARKLIRFL